MSFQFNGMVLDENEEISDSNSNLSLNKTSSDKVNKIKQIIESHFNEEINYKKLELETIDDRLHQAKNTLDKLRVCIICKFYSLDGQISIDDYKNHPTIRQLRCEHLEMAASNQNTVKDISLENGIKDESDLSNDSNEKFQVNYKQFILNLSVGNVSKYLKSSSAQISSEQDENGIESSQYNQDLITHKWMIYIRSANCPKLESYIKKVVFYLHSSYKPYDVVEVKSSPFQLIKRGWGEFPIHVQIHFKDPRNKRVDVSHLLKLDWTQTGLQTFGGESNQEIELIIKQNDFISTTNNTNSINNPSMPEIGAEDTLNNNIVLKNSIQQLAVEPKIIQKINQQDPVPKQKQPEQSEQKPTTSSVASSASLNDLFNLRPKLSNPVNLNLNQTTIKTLPILLNENKPINSSLNEISAKIITSKLNINKPVILSSIVSTPNITNPIASQLLLGNKIKPIESFSQPNNNLSKTQNKTLNNLNFKTVDINDTSPKIYEKRHVIYRVDSSDVQNKEDKNYDKTSHLLNSEIETQHNSLNSIECDSQQNNKKIRLSSNHLTKVIPNQSEPSDLAKRKLVENDNTENSLEKKTKLANDETTMENIKQVNDQNLNTVDLNCPRFTQTNQLIYSVESLAEQFNVNTNIEINHKPILTGDNNTFENWIKLSLRHFPIVLNFNFETAFTETPNRRKQNLVFCARTLQEFYMWPYAKRKANEWLRALNIKRFITDKIQKNIPIWSTKAIVLYLRSHGHTPLENQHIDKTANLKKDVSQYHYVNSMTPINHLLKLSKKEMIFSQIPEAAHEEEIEIDIESIEMAKTQYKKQHNQHIEMNENNQNMIEICPDAKYIKEKLDLLNIKTNPVNLVVSDEIPCEENTYTCSLVEKFMFVLCKRFADDLIRQTCADMYLNRDEKSFSISLNKNAKKSANNSTETNDSILNQKFPASLNVMNIFDTIKKHEKFDFLTNKYMAMATASPVKSSNPDVNLGQTDQLYSNSNINKNNNNTNNINNNNTNKVLTIFK